MSIVSLKIRLLIISIGLFLLSSCGNILNVKISTKATEAELKVLKFDQFITDSQSVSCGITRDKKLFCNEQKIERGSSLFEQSIPLEWPAKTVEAGRNHFCAIFEGPLNDEVWCKGAGSSGQLGDGLSLSSKILVKVIGLPATRFLNLAADNGGTCLVTEENEVYCWGIANFPNGVLTSSTTAFKTLLTGVNEIKSTQAAYCALKKEDKTLWCWGSGGNGNLGQGNFTSYWYTPVQVKAAEGPGALEDIEDFAVGQLHTCAISNKEVYCWGNAIRSGVDQEGSVTLPTHLAGLSGAVKVAAGDSSSCAILKTNEVYCWGYNKNLQIGGTEASVVAIPKKVEFPASVGEIINLSIGNGSNPSFGRVCALTKSGEVYCWGAGVAGVFGSLSPLIAREFTLQPYSNISSLDISSHQMCLINNDLPYSSGFNDYDQLESIRYIVNSPSLMSDKFVSNYGCSRYANCYVSEGKMFCKGLSYTGRAEITALRSDVSKAVLSSHTTCALMNNSDLKCWGTNTNGQVGNEATATVATATPYLTMTNVVSGNGGLNVMCALKSDKSVWCWGSNVAGTVGHDNSLEVNVLTPRLVQGLPDLTLANKLSLKVETQTACLQVDNEIYCWGANVGTLLSLGTENAFKAYKLSTLSGKIEKMAIINKGVCASYDDFSISCLTINSSSLIIFNNDNDSEGVHKQTFAPIGPIAELDGGTHLLCQLLTNGKIYCLGNNSYGGMVHEGISSPLVLNPSKWQP